MVVFIEISDGNIVNQFPSEKYYSNISIPSGGNAKITLTCRVKELVSNSEVMQK